MNKIHSLLNTICLQPGWLEAANGILSFKAAGFSRLSAPLVLHEVEHTYNWVLLGDKRHSSTGASKF